MTQTAQDYTSTTYYPVFASKAAWLSALAEELEGPPDASRLWELLRRLDNTDTSTWADPTARHDD